MKKLLIFIIALFVMVGTAYGGSSRVLSVDRTQLPQIRIRIYATGDSIANLELDLNDYDFGGTYLYGIKTIPSSPDAAYDVAVQDSDTGVVCDAISRSTSAIEFFACSDTTGKFERIMTDLTVVIDDLGSAKSTIIVLDFVK